MKLFATSLALVAALLLFTVPAPAQETPDMPPVLMEELGLYPDCTVIQSTQVGAAETCLLDCGKTHPNKMATHYKRQMDANGYKPTTLGAADGGALAAGEKQGASARALAKKADGYTEVLLTIDNITALGGTPVVPEAEEQAAAPVAEQAEEQAAQPEPAAEEAPAEETAPAAEQASGQEVMGQGLAGEIWELVDPRPGDTLLEEMVLHGHPVAIFATGGPVEAVLEYYRQALEAQGWMKLTHMLQDGEGMIIMVTEGAQFQVICQQGVHPNHKGLGYSIMLAKAPQQ